MTNFTSDRVGDKEKATTHVCGCGILGIHPWAAPGLLPSSGVFTAIASARAFAQLLGMLVRLGAHGDFLLPLFAAVERQCKQASAMQSLGPMAAAGNWRGSGSGWW